MRKTKFSTQQIVLVGLFAALVFVGTQIFRIPIGPAFVHFGNIFLMLGAICLGPIPGTIAGVIGFMIFDLLNGYASDIPKIVLLSIVKGFTCGYLYGWLYGKIDHTWAVVFSAFLAFLTYPILDIVWRTVELTLAGSNVRAAFWVGVGSQLSPIINMAVGTIVVPIFYTYIFKRVFEIAHIPLYRS